MTHSADSHDHELLRTLDPQAQDSTPWADLHSVGAVEVLLPMPLDEREQLPTVRSGLAEEGESMTMVFAGRAPRGDLATVEVRMLSEDEAVKALKRGVLPAASVRIQEVLGTGQMDVTDFAARCVVADESVVPTAARVTTPSPGLRAALGATETEPHARATRPPALTTPAGHAPRRL